MNKRKLRSGAGLADKIRLELDGPAEAPAVAVVKPAKVVVDLPAKPMVYAYIRVSTDRQTVENQKYEILKATSAKKMHVDRWIEETASGTLSADHRQLGLVLDRMKKGDQLYVAELSRIGRSMLEVMSILHTCMEKGAIVISIKEGYELGNNLNSKVLAFAFSLAAELERDLISQRTKEALARRKSEGVILGRPSGSKSIQTKLTGKEAEIEALIDKGVSFSAIGRIYGVDRQTVKNFVDRIEESK